MSPENSKNNLTKYGIVIAAFVFAGIVIYFLSRERYTNDMLSEVRATLVDYGLDWAGRGRDYAQYSVTFNDKEDSVYSALYRIHASTEPGPGLVVLHMNENADDVFARLTETELSSSCAIVSIDVSQFFVRDSKGNLRTENKYLGRAIIPALKTTDLALEFIRGHRIVDTSAVYLVAVGEANLVGLPAAANYGNDLAGFVSIQPEKMFGFRAGDDEFAAPSYWAPLLKTKKALLVNSEDKAESKRMTQLSAALPVQASRMSAPASNEREGFVRGLGAAIKWIMKDRPKSAAIPSAPTPPLPTQKESIIVRK